MSLNAIGLLVFPALAIFSLYIVHYAQSPTASKQHVMTRIRRYCFMLYLIWFGGISSLVLLILNIGQNQLSTACDYASGQLNTCILNSGNPLQVILFFGSIALIALIPTGILYLCLHGFHYLYVGYEKPKGKPKKNDDIAE